MKSSPARAATVTFALLLAGAIIGAMAGVLGALIAVAITDGPGAAFSPMIVGMAAILGGVLGAPLLPAASWLLMRRVPLGAAFLGTPLGAMLGGIAGWVLAVTLDGNPILWPAGAAILGFLAAVLLLRRRFAAPREAAVRVPGVAA
jgi:hypothetical protein